MNINVGDGRTVVTTAGTSVQLSTVKKILEVIITAETDNTGIIVIGASTVVAALATRRGVPLLAGESIILKESDLANIYLDSTVDTDGVTYLWLA